ncbi:MAG TPA: hypothetical protein VFN61_13905 [Acidimicrobiales bacterium]|nr:hypothetical protein [Acidimicrobiales bacterium]
MQLGTGTSHRRLVWVLGGLVIAFLVATGAMFVFPPTDQPQRVDGVLGLNGTFESARAAKAVSLVEQGYARTLLFSVGNSGTACPTVPHVKVVCFVAVPGRTVGEAEFAGAYARRHGWHSMIVVASRAQALRARLIVGRCFHGRLLVVPARVQPAHFPFEVLYEWAALGKALVVDTSC